MKYVVLGSSGLLGKSLIKVGKKRNLNVLGLSRKNKKYKFDFLKVKKLFNLLNKIKPQIIINAAGIVNIDFCENNVREIMKINAISLKFLAEFSRKNNVKLVQISTDHFFTDDENKKHKENSKIKIMNQYAKSKFLSEKNTKKHKNHIIIRTNFTGFRGDPKKQTFIEWLLKNFKEKKKVSLFRDFYCSTIDVETLAHIIYDLIDVKFTGLINIGSNDVFSKKQFAKKIIKILGLNDELIIDGSVKTLKTKRANSLGLNVSKVEKVLKYKMPSMNQVCKNLIRNLKK